MSHNHRNNKPLQQRITVNNVLTDQNQDSDNDRNDDYKDNQVHNNRIEVKINATTIDKNSSEHETPIAPLINKDFQEITIKVSINGQAKNVIIDTGSPVTVINKRFFNRMSKTFDEGGFSNKSELIKSSVSLYSCEAESAVSTMGECDVILEHKGSKCVTSVIVAKKLAHECL